jgi:hypothetical protein
LSKIENGIVASYHGDSACRIGNALGIHPAFLVEENFIVACALIGLPAMMDVDRAAILAWCERRVK